MKKQGFTLIELMVVIVIMGILAAVAVPKLFGMIAKSKASEIGPAAGEYVKLQDAYVSESGIYVGNWTKIGYTMANSVSFTYGEGGLSAGTTTLAGLGKTSGWVATANAKLNDCAANATWTISVKENGAGAGAGGPVLYKADYSDKTHCDPLTPNFERLTSSTWTD